MFSRRRLDLLRQVGQKDLISRFEALACDDEKHHVEHNMVGMWSTLVFTAGLGLHHSALRLEAVGGGHC